MMITQIRPTNPIRVESVTAGLSLVLIACFCFPGNALGDPPKSGAGTSQTALKPNSEAIMRAMEPPADEEYTLDAGDEIAIEIADRPEMSGKHVMGPDGRITLPLYGPIKLAGLTREAAAAAIAKAMSTYFLNPSVNVRVEKYGSNRVLLVGKVATPGPMYFDRVPTLLEVISRGGVTGSTPNGGSLPARCAIFRGRDQAVWLNLRAMANSGSSALEMRLKRNDVVFIPDDSDEYVTVMGEVNRPGVVPLIHDTNLNDALAASGGLTEKASEGHIQVIRASDGKTLKITLADALHNRNGAEALLHKGDVVYVPRSGWSKAGDIVQTITPIGSMVMLGAMVGATGGW